MIARKNYDHPAFIRGMAYCAEADNAPQRSMLMSEPLAHAARVVYRAAGITNPRRQLDVLEVQEPYSCFELSYYESLGLCPLGGAAELVMSGATLMSGDIPVNPSGGCLGANPIGAAGLIRLIEAAMQVSGKAGEHQIQGARLAAAQTGGGWANLRGLAVVSND
jgi:acetyl-CoA C-acetyltransferase